MELPFILAGDFNLRIEKVLAKFEHPEGNAYKYPFMPLKRRESKKLIGYYISSITLALDDIAVVDWETVENANSHMCALWIFCAKDNFKFEK